MPPNFLLQMFLSTNRVDKALAYIQNRFCTNLAVDTWKLFDSISATDSSLTELVRKKKTEILQQFSSLPAEQLQEQHIPIMLHEGLADYALCALQKKPSLLSPPVPHSYYRTSSAPAAALLAVEFMRALSATPEQKVAPASAFSPAAGVSLFVFF
jgi:hypothetical protein